MFKSERVHDARDPQHPNICWGSRVARAFTLTIMIHSNVWTTIILDLYSQATFQIYACSRTACFAVFSLRNHKPTHPLWNAFPSLSSVAPTGSASKGTFVRTCTIHFLFVRVRCCDHLILFTFMLYGVTYIHIYNSYDIAHEIAHNDRTCTFKTRLNTCVASWWLHMHVQDPELTY